MNSLSTEYTLKECGESRAGLTHVSVHSKYIEEIFVAETFARIVRTYEYKVGDISSGNKILESQWLYVAYNAE